jgi:hypothetical protein
MLEIPESENIQNRFVCVQSLLPVHTRSIFLATNIRAVEILADHRRHLPFQVRAEGDRFGLTFAFDDPRRARHFAYDLSGWSAPNFSLSLKVAFSRV